MRNSSSDRAIFHEDCEREHQFSPRHSENRRWLNCLNKNIFGS